MESYLYIFSISWAGTRHQNFLELSWFSTELNPCWDPGRRAIILGHFLRLCVKSKSIFWNPWLKPSSPWINCSSWWNEWKKMMSSTAEEGENLKQTRQITCLSPPCNLNHLLSLAFNLSLSGLSWDVWTGHPLSCSLFIWCFLLGTWSWKSLRGGLQFLKLSLKCSQVALNF